MSKGDKVPHPAGKARAARDNKDERLAAALRANLKRRKAQARDRATGSEQPGSGIDENGPKSR
jgi:hypothetical protein